MITYISLSRQQKTKLKESDNEIVLKYVREIPGITTEVLVKKLSKDKGWIGGRNATQKVVK